MIDERLERMKRKHNCRVYFDSDSFKISDCTVAPVHDIPDVYMKIRSLIFMLSQSMMYICSELYIAKIVL